MKRITAIRSEKGKKVLFLDGKAALKLETGFAVKEGLEVGKELTESELASLQGEALLERTLRAAERYLGRRPQSERELRQKLEHRGFAKEAVAAVLARLRAGGMLDDTAFARFWRENRDSFRPQSRWLTEQELKKKGVSEEIIREVVSNLDDSESAYQAAQAKVRRLAALDYPDFRRRMGEYLRRRGFDYGVTRSTVKRLWEERTAPEK